MSFGIWSLDIIDYIFCTNVALPVLSWVIQAVAALPISNEYIKKI